MKSWLAALFVGVAGAGSLGGLGCGPDPSTVKDGRGVYQMMCATCHGSDGRPPATMATRLGVRDLTSAEFRARSTLELVEHQVRAGSKNKLMPAFAGALDDDKIRAVAAFVASPEFGAPPPAPR